jgi:glutamyl/glutaminyl-tRNA synthetase
MPKYLALYDALGVGRPIFAHLPHILAPDGKKKLGKRDGAKSVSEYRADGILPEAMINFLAMLGWNDGTEQDIFTLEELVGKFSLDRVHKSGARFDEKRLVWLNSAWIRKLADEDFAKLVGYAEDFWGENARKASPDFREKVLKIVAERLKTLADLPALTEYFFTRPTPNWTMIDENKQLKKFAKTELVDLLEISRKSLSKLSDADFANTEKLQETLNNLLAETDQKPSILFSTIRFALTWAPFSPSLPEIFATLGRAESLTRIDAAIASAE